MYVCKRNRTFLLLLSLVVTCLGLTTKGSAQEKTLTVRSIAEAPAFAKRALVIGIGDYEHAASLAPTTYNDAKKVADLLQKQFGFPAESIVLMTDAPDTPDKLRPTFIHLKSAISTLLNGINEKSEVVIYFSGHGTRADNHDWLVPLDGLPAEVESTCINYDDFRSRLDTKAPARALLIVDACRNLRGGKDGGPSGFGAGRVLVGSQFAELLSCQPKEISQVGKKEDFSESVFTHYLLEGLQGAPEAQSEGVVTFDSLKLFVQGSVSQYVSSKFGESQNPDGRASLGKMVLAKGLTGSVKQQPVKLLPQLGPKVTTLFDGNSLGAWTNVTGGRAAWLIQDGELVVVPRTGNLVTTEKYGDFDLHLEFNLANMPDKQGQGRSNSGVFLHGLYEIQILDSVNNPTFWAGACGAIFLQKDPDRNVCKQPGEWQTYDISFRAPRFDTYGNVVTPPRVTLIWNGVKVHNNVELTNARMGNPGNLGPPLPMVATGPIILQDHGAPVRFRNIRVTPIK
jgi:hypothetical protein